MVEKITINELEAGMLDAVLETCGEVDKLDRNQLLELFDGDEELASSMVTLLIEAGFVEPDGLSTSPLPAWIAREPDAEAFLANGGFSAQFTIPPKEVPFEIEITGEHEAAEIIPETVSENPVKIDPLTEHITEIKELQLEIEHLRQSEMLAKHDLRKKEMQLQNMQTTQQQLLNMRLFIWVLLGLIVLLILVLFFRK